MKKKLVEESTSNPSRIAKVYAKLANMLPGARIAFVEGIMFALDSLTYKEQDDVNTIYEMLQMSSRPMVDIEKFVFGDDDESDED